MDPAGQRIGVRDDDCERGYGLRVIGAEHPLSIEKQHDLL
jgi:hypothetical protein